MNPGPRTARELVLQLCEEMGVQWSDLFGIDPWTNKIKRSRDIVAMRHKLWAEARRRRLPYGQVGWVELAKACGLKSHSTIVAALKRKPS